MLSNYKQFRTEPTYSPMKRCRVDYMGLDDARLIDRLGRLGHRLGGRSPVLSPWRSRLSPRAVLQGFIVGKLILAQAFL